VNPANQLSRVSEDVPVFPRRRCPGADGRRIAAGAARGHEYQHPVELVDGGRRRRFLDLHLETLERTSVLIENRTHRAQAGSIAAVRQRRVDLNDLERRHLDGPEQQ